jgi:hypothetical protein
MNLRPFSFRYILMAFGAPPIEAAAPPAIIT